MTYAPGASCQFSLDYVTASDAGETDGDFGLNETSISLQGTCVPGTCVSYQMTVEDPPATSVPEPSSLFLFGSGFVVALGEGVAAESLRSSGRGIEDDCGKDLSS